MNELVILNPLRSGALPDGKGAYIDVETNEGPRQLRFTVEDAERLHAALHQALKQFHTARLPQRWETALDPVEQEAVLRTHFSDGTSEETHIPRCEIGGIVRFLQHALRRFYEGKLGFKLKEATSDGVYYEFAGGTACFLYPTPGAGTSKASQAFWQVDDVERVVRELERLAASRRSPTAESATRPPLPS